MYKDVKKKLLAVVVSICMVIGVVEIVPRVKAAAAFDGEYYTIPLQQGGHVKVKLKGNLALTYKGVAQDLPVIDSVLNENNEKITDATFYLVSMGNDTNAGDFPIGLRCSNPGKYNLSTGQDALIVLNIAKATIQQIVVKDASGRDQEKQVLLYSGNPVQAKIGEGAKVYANIGTGLVSIGDDYNIEKLNSVGIDQSCPITITGNMADNFTNPDGVGDNKHDGGISCDVAYDLSKMMTLQTPSFTYTPGTDHRYDVKVSLKNPWTNTSKEDITMDNAQGLKMTITPSNVEAVGTYTVKVTPPMGADNVCMIDDKPYAGAFEKTFTVERENASEIQILAFDENNKNAGGPAEKVDLLKLPDDYIYCVNLSKYKSGAPVGLEVKIGEASYYEGSGFTATY